VLSDLSLGSTRTQAERRTVLLTERTSSQGEAIVEHRADVAGRGAPLGEYFLARLARLAEIRRAWLENVVIGEPPELLDYALASTYADCLRLGLRAQAQELLVILDSDEDCRGSRGE
jgi:hypothetical protein